MIDQSLVIESSTRPTHFGSITNAIESGIDGKKYVLDTLRIEDSPFLSNYLSGNIPTSLDSGINPDINNQMQHLKKTSKEIIDAFPNHKFLEIVYENEPKLIVIDKLTSDGVIQTMNVISASMHDSINIPPVLEHCYIFNINSREMIDPVGALKIADCETRLKIFGSPGVNILFKRIFIAPIMTPGFIYCYIHEIGHLIDRYTGVDRFKSDAARERESKGEINSKEKQEIIQDERAATAIALNIIRTNRFFLNMQKEYPIQFHEMLGFKDYALNTYGSLRRGNDQLTESNKGSNKSLSLLYRLRNLFRRSPPR